MANELITVKQLPVLDERFKEIGAALDEKVERCKAMVVTDENRKDIKKIRAELNKERMAFAEEFTVVKAEVLGPWQAVEDAYKENVQSKYKEADAALKVKIDEIEQGLKDKKEVEIRKFFEEHLAAAGIDFVTWEQAGIKVGLSDSKKSLQEQAKAFVDRVTQDIALIDTDKHAAEIMAEYKKTLNASQAIMTVRDRFEREERERKEREAREEARRQQEEHERMVAEQMKQAAQEAVAMPTVTPIEEPVHPVPQQPQEQILSVAFKVTGTLSEIKALVRTLEDAGIKYEQINA